MQNNATMRYLKTIILAKIITFQMAAGREGEALVQSWWNVNWNNSSGGQSGNISKVTKACPTLSTHTHRAKMSAHGHPFTMCVTENGNQYLKG